jgi:hypothetical protein
VIGCSGIALAWLSYALLYVARSPRAPLDPAAWRWVCRAGATLLFAASAWTFARLEGGFGGVLLATLAWTTAASLIPLLHRASPRLSRASLVAAGFAALLGAFLAT